LQTTYPKGQEEGEEVYEKAREIIEEGRARGSLTLEGFQKKVEVGGRERVVEVTGWGAELEESWSGEFLLRIKITAEVDGVRSEHLDLRQARRQQDRRTRRGEGQRAGRQRSRRRKVLDAD
jgi:hypothetical protein